MSRYGWVLNPAHFLLHKDNSHPSFSVISASIGTMTDLQYSFGMVTYTFSPSKGISSRIKCNPAFKTEMISDSDFCNKRNDLGSFL